MLYINKLRYSLLPLINIGKPRVKRDIDSDFKTDIRDKVLDYVKHKYGEEAVCCVMTRGTQQVKAAIRNCARLLGLELYDDKTRFYNLGDEICKAVPDVLNVKFKDCWDDLVGRFSQNPNAMAILNNARLIEGSFLNIGQHAAGVIISDNGDVSEHLPLLYSRDKEQWVAQVTKEECEELGTLKMDFLGLNNLNIITDTLRTIKARTGEKIDIEKVPFEPEVFSRIFATGNTNSIFQFESPGMKQMLRRFKPTSIEDIILLVAAFRPGPMQFLDDIIAVKHGQKKPEYAIPEMAEVLDQTYGSPVYQEQIMQIFNKFAGFSLGESDIIRRYMSKKKTEKFAAYKDKFILGLVERGAELDAAQDFWEQLLKFSQYAFNKSHAAAYAFVAYYTAWLKYHYPVEYLTAVMNNTDFEKLGGLINDCKVFGIPVEPPRINESDTKFTVSEDGAAIYGLKLVKNVASGSSLLVEERNKNGKYLSFADFLLRTRARKDVVESLIKAGAFDEFSKSRGALMVALPDFLYYLDKIKKKEAIIEDETKSAKSHENAEKAMVSLIESLNNVIVNIEGTDNLAVRLKDEKEMTGAYVSSHPVNSYGSAENNNCIEIVNAIGKATPKATPVSIFGLIKDLKITHRTSDGAPMAFFALEDLTGSIKVSCFTEKYKEFAGLIKDDTVIKVSGTLREERDSRTDETYASVVVKNISEVKEVKPQITLFIKNIVEWKNIYNSLLPYRDNNGFPLLVYDKLNGIFRETTLLISKDILKNKSFETSM